MTRRSVLTGATSLFGVALLATLGRRSRAAMATFPFNLGEAEWRHRLTTAQFDVLREAGTEAPGSSPLDHEFSAGRYRCAGCDHPLFVSATKFDSGTGWPSFFQPLAGAVATNSDHSLLMNRTEVHCARCGGHLGHVFEDGPKPTGLRYCMNGVALTFDKATA